MRVLQLVTTNGFIPDTTVDTVQNLDLPIKCSEQMQKAVLLGTNKRIKIAQVKEGIYNPNLPSLRTMSMDDRLGKLSDEHVRTSIPVGVDLPKELFYQYNSSSYYIPNYEVLPLYFMKWEEDKMAETLSFLNNPQLEERWKEFKKFLPLGMHRVEHIPQVKDFHYMNYQVRYQRPEPRNVFKAHPIKDPGVRSSLQKIKQPKVEKELPKVEEKQGVIEDCQNSCPLRNH